MQIINVHSQQKDWFNKFVSTHPFGTIHQTYEWAKFQEKIPGREKSWILAVVDKQFDIRGSAVLIKQNLPFGKSWLYCPRGPLAAFDSLVWEMLFKEIKSLAKKEQAIFFRMDPILEIDNPENFKECLQPGFIRAHADYQPQTTILIDLKESEEQILNQMKPKGRYNIKLAEKKGVKIITPDDNLSLEKAIDEFYKLLTQTTARDNFSPHQKEFYANFLNEISLPFTKGPQARREVRRGFLNGTLPSSQLYLASYENKIIAGIIVTYFKDTATYYFGASSNEHRNVMAPYLLQWTAMQDAKKAGFKFYDLFGIAPENAKNHAWQGVTEFKNKFGGDTKNYCPSQEFIFKKLWYKLMLLAKKRK